jgi:serine/threonine protein kinase
MGEEAGAARALFERYLKARLKHPELEFEDWLAGHERYADSLRLLYSQQSTGLFRSPRGEPGGTASYQAGETLGDFRLIEYLGSGGMGEVWKAEQLSVRRPVALKLIRRDKQLTARALARFEREAQAGGRIRHPNIAAVHTVGSSGERPFIAQELVEGGSPLSDFVQRMRGEELPSDYFPKLAELFATILDALQAAHDAGVIHRDLKPQNILVAPDDRPVIVDFGLARIEDADPLSRTGDLVGTYFYMSPEQAMSRRISIDHRTDVFSAGATLYELLTFRRAFDGETTHEVAEKILFSDPPEPRSVQHRVPRDLALICGKALEKRREDRYQTAREFADDLRRTLADEPIRAKPVGPLRRGVKWARRHPAVASTAGVGLVGASLVLWLLGNLSTSEEARTEAERNTLYESARLALKENQVDRAIELIGEATSLDALDPTGHLILALGFAKFSRVAEMEEQIRLAAEKGFSLDGRSLETGIDHLAYALHLMSLSDLSLYPKAVEQARTALERDPLLTETHYVLYQLHVALGDTEGAAADLEAFQASLASGNPFWKVAEALRAELAGDHARACALLEELPDLPDVDARRLRELRYDRNLGRNYLALGDLERAEPHLRRAVEEPRDCASMNALAALAYERYRADETDLFWLGEIETWSAASIECGGLLRLPWMLAAWAAIERFGKEDPSGDPRSRASWTAARDALDRLAARDADDPDLPRLEARLLFLEARYPLDSKDFRAAADLLAAAVDADAESLRSRALLGQCLWHLGQHERGLEELQAALELWDSADDQRWRPKWLGVVLTWAYGNAAAAGEVERAGSLRERIARALEVPGAFDPEELLSLADFLASDARPELQDCALALDIVERFELRTAFTGSPVAEEAQGLLDTIDRLCP